MPNSSDRSESESYELIYGGGGHGGPYLGYTVAKEAAQRLILGSQTERCIYIVPRSAPSYNRIHAVDEVRRL